MGAGGKPRCIAHSPPLARSGAGGVNRKLPLSSFQPSAASSWKIALPWHCSANAGRGNGPLAWVSAYGSATSGAALTTVPWPGVTLGAGSSTRPDDVLISKPNSVAGAGW